MTLSNVHLSAPRLTLAAAVAVLALSAPGGASAAGCQAPPGTNAYKQYCEAVPNASGGDDTARKREAPATTPIVADGGASTVEPTTAAAPTTPAVAADSSGGNTLVRAILGFSALGAFGALMLWRGEKIPPADET